jgi:hypothetical protein
LPDDVGDETIKVLRRVDVMSGGATSPNDYRELIRSDGM